MRDADAYMNRCSNTGTHHPAIVPDDDVGSSERLIDFIHLYTTSTTKKKSEEEMEMKNYKTLLIRFER